MPTKKTLEHYLRQLRLIEEHREQYCERNVKRYYKELMTDLQKFLGVQYAALAEDDRLTMEILQEKSSYARFLEEVEQKINSFSPEAAQEIRNTVQLSYKHAYDGMIKAVENSDTYEKLKVNLSGIKAATPDVIKNAVNNKYMEKALTKNHKSTVYDIRQQIAIGLSQGDRMSTMARRLNEQVNKSYRKAVQIARTETHRVREAGFQDSSERLSQVLKDNDSDYVMIKTWKTMEDMSVRPYRMKGKKGHKTAVKGNGPDHVKMNGVTVLVEEEFDLGDGNFTKAPGQSGVAGHDINCRCYLSRDLVTKAEYEQLTGKSLIDKKKIVEEQINTLDDIKGTKLYDEISNDLESYVGGGYSSVADALNYDKAKIKYVTDSMTDYDGKLYRIEEQVFTVDRKNLKIGETFEFDDDIRSFSRDKRYVDSLLDDFSDVYFEEPVVFETVGKIKHLDMSKFTENYFEDQSESLIAGKFKVIDVSDKTINGTNVKVVKIEQISEETKKAAKRIKVDYDDYFNDYSIDELRNAVLSTNTMSFTEVLSADEKDLKKVLVGKYKDSDEGCDVLREMYSVKDLDYAKTMDVIDNIPNDALPDTLNRHSKFQKYSVLELSDDLPEIVEDISKLEGSPIYRAVYSAANGIKGSSIQQMTRYSKNAYQGYGIFGDGLYFTNSEAGTATYGGDVMVAKLKPSAKIIDEGDLTKLMDKEGATGDRSVFAVMHGYDAISVNINKAEQGEVYYAVLKRSALWIQK